MQRLGEFLVKEDGAVTVDWVVLTAATVTLALLIMAFVGDSVGALATYIATEVLVAENFFEP